MDGRVGLVVVSHSRDLATAAVALAREMAPPDLPIEVAAGMDGPDGPEFGTDAVAIAGAVAAADRGAGVVVLMDLGSAVLSAELALDLLADPDQRDRVLLCPAPLVEGLVVAAVAAGGGASRAEVAEEATGALAGKLAQLGGGTGHGGPDGPVASTASSPAPRPGAGGVGTEPRSAATFVVGNPHGLHARPAARLVALVRGHADVRVELRNLTTGSDWAPAASLARVAVLGVQVGHEVEVAATGAGADAAVAAVLELAGRDFDEPGSAGSGAGLVAAEPGDGAGERGGSGRAGPGSGVAPAVPGAPVAGSSGIAVGVVRVQVTAPVAVPDTPAEDPATERDRFDRAVAAARTGIEASRDAAARGLGADEAAIFDAHLMMLDDPELAGATRTGIDGGASAAAAWAEVVERQAAALAAVADPYLAARAADVRAVGDQVLRELVALARAPGSDGGVPDPVPPGRGVGSGADRAAPAGDGAAGPASPSPPVVLVAADLTPAQAALLDPAEVAGVVLAAGSPTAHATLLLRARGVPAVLGAGGAVLDLADGTPIALDGDTGELVVDPSPERLAGFRDRAAARAGRDRVAAGRAGEPAITRDGVRVLVGANIGAREDAVAAAAGGADLAGLVRTEFLFLDRAQAPDVEEQVAAYRGIAEALGGRRITLRTLDVGGDKPLPYLPLPAEANPFLGLRGIRLADRHAGLFRDQLLAAVRVAHETPVSLMFPMVSTLDELLAARRELAAVIAAEGRGTPSGLQVGIMVEVPAAALKAAAFVPHVEFLSIGTNDLVQYALAAERGNPAVAHLADPLDPGVLRLVQAVCRAAGDRVLVAVCGEAAADPRAATVLVGLGVRELSVVPPAVPGIKQLVRDLDTAGAASTATDALDS